VIEGEEETAGSLELFARTHPELFECDMFIITDMERFLQETRL